MSPSQKSSDVFALNSHTDDPPPVQATGQLSCPDKISEGKQLSVFPELLFSDACVYVLPFTGVKNSHCLNQVVKKPAEEDCSLFQVSHSQQAEDDRVSSHY